jgi:hypothetical protein
LVSANPAARDTDVGADPAAGALDRDRPAGGFEIWAAVKHLALPQFRPLDARSYAAAGFQF